jgi:Lon protease-like protein
MSKKLPARPNLEHLKAQAKDLQRASKTLALHDAQRTIAREYGFASWKSLRDHVERAQNVSALMQRHIGAPMPAEVQAALTKTIAPGDGQRANVEMPSEMPVIAVRNALMTVGIRAPLNIGRASSLAAIRAGGPIALLAQKSEVVEEPMEDDLHRVGCAADVTDVITTEDRGTWIVIRTFASIELDAIVQTTPYLRARVSPFVVRADDSPDVRKLEAELRRRVIAFAQKLPHPELLVRATETMNARELGDAILANLGASVEDKARVASETDLASRLAALLALFDRAA